MDAELTLRAPERLAEFNRAGILAPADVHVARTLCELAAVTEPDVLLAVALAVRAPRRGHVFVDLARIAESAEAEREAARDGSDTAGTEEAEAALLRWPAADVWVAAVAGARSLVAVDGDPVSEERPLRLRGTCLYLDRYWRQEDALAARLREMGLAAPRATDLDELGTAVRSLFPEPEDELQRVAATCGALRRLAVIAGGPGTGKTTTVARTVALLYEQARARGEEMPLIALAAPTGRAAARMLEAVHAEAPRPETADAAGEQMLKLRSSTIHRLLGWRPSGRFRHNAANRLPHDVVIIDETSMVSLWLMARLVEAVRGDAQLVLVGDPDQLAAIEAGAVLRDIVGPASEELRMGAGMRAIIARVSGDELPSAGGEYSFGDGVVVLRRSHRFGSEIGDVADAIRRGDADQAVTALRAGVSSDAIVWITPEDALEPLQEAAVSTYSSVVLSARAGDAATAIDSLSRFRLMCAHRHGPYGVSIWTARIEAWLAAAVPDFEPGERDYAGRPLLISANDAELGLNNGDAGVVVADEPNGGLSAAFMRESEVARFAPSRLQAVETLYASTIHKAQGSQFATAAVLLPEPDSPLLTRELLYTAATRARLRLILIGGEESVRAAVERPVERATGLRQLLWD